MTMHSKLIAATFAAFVFCVAQPAAAAGKPDALVAKLKAWDPDNDGTLDLAEVKKAAEARFAALEKDKDGTLDTKEVRGLGISKAEFKKADPDNDGTLDLKEYLTIVEARFKAANPDNDGTLDLKELKTKAGKALLLLLP
jgi:Ca2+-binding EF-hand superfamily protein